MKRRVRLRRLLVPWGSRRRDLLYRIRKPWTFPPYGSRRARLKRWLRDHKLMTRRTHQRELERRTTALYSTHKREEEELKKQLDSMLPRIASGLLEFDREQQSLVLTTFLGDAVVRSLWDHPGDKEQIWGYVGERLGHEVTRQLRSLDFGTVLRGPRVLIGDRFIDPWRMGPPRR